MASDGSGNKTLLVVEDNEISREGLALLLRQDGYTVVVAADGREALGFLRGSPAPDLILLDMMMPALDGWRFLALRKQDPALAAIPVIITTALEIASAEWASALGAADILRKPIETESLLRAVRRFLP